MMDYSVYFFMKMQCMLSIFIVVAICNTRIMCYFVSHIETMLCYSILLELFNFDSTNFIPFLHYEDQLKGIFIEVKKKFETTLGVLKKEKITIDPDDYAAISQYAQVMKTAREK
jgi:hypothetical protein